MYFKHLLKIRRTTSTDTTFSGVENKELFIDEKETLGTILAYKDLTGNVKKIYGHDILSSTDSDKGASLIGINVSGVTGNTIKLAIENLKSQIDTLEAGGLVLEQTISTSTTEVPSSNAVKTYVDTGIKDLKKILDIQGDVESFQQDDLLDPTASPVSGTRYIIGNNLSLHTNFGTISGLGVDDIVEYNGSEWEVFYDVSVRGPGALVWVKDESLFYLYNGSSWVQSTLTVPVYTFGENVVENSGEISVPTSGLMTSLVNSNVVTSPSAAIGTNESGYLAVSGYDVADAIDWGYVVSNDFDTNAFDVVAEKVILKLDESLIIDNTTGLKVYPQNIIDDDSIKIDSGTGKIKVNTDSLTINLVDDVTTWESSGKIASKYNTDYFYADSGTNGIEPKNDLGKLLLSTLGSVVNNSLISVDENGNIEFVTVIDGGEF